MFHPHKGTSHKYMEFEGEIDKNSLKHRKKFLQFIRSLDEKEKVHKYIKIKNDSLKKSFFREPEKVIKNPLPLFYYYDDDLSKIEKHKCEQKKLARKEVEIVHLATGDTLNEDQIEKRVIVKDNTEGVIKYCIVYIILPYYGKHDLFTILNPPEDKKSEHSSCKNLLDEIKKNILKITEDCKRSLARLHIKKIAHLDIKPENIMFYKSKFWFIDPHFSPPKRKNTYGTINYIYPDKNKILNIYARDIYALGLVFCEVFSVLIDGSCLIEMFNRNFSNPSVENLQEVIKYLEKYPEISDSHLLIFVQDILAMLKYPDKYKLVEQFFEQNLNGSGNAKFTYGVP